MNNDVVLKLYEKYAQDIFRFAYSYLTSYSDAQDVVHEVFLKLLKNRRGKLNFLVTVSDCNVKNLSRLPFDLAELGPDRIVRRSIRR